MPGLHDKPSEGTFSWISDNSRITYDNWHSGEPNNNGGGKEEDCVRMSARNGKWNDVICSKETAKTICQKP